MPSLLELIIFAESMGSGLHRMRINIPDDILPKIVFGPPASEQIDVRDLLKSDLSQLHDSLHNHAMLREGSQTFKNLRGVQQILVVFLILFEKIESSRLKLDLDNQYSLSDEISALCEDLIEVEIPILNRKFALYTEREVLGALYVAFGSNFGKSSLASRFNACKEAYPVNFIHKKPNVSLWRSLCNRLNDSVNNMSEYDELKFGAHTAFCAFKEMADFTMLLSMQGIDRANNSE